MAEGRAPFKRAPTDALAERKKIDEGRAFAVRRRGRALQAPPVARRLTVQSDRPKPVKMNFVDKGEGRGLISFEPVKAVPASPERRNTNPAFFAFPLNPQPF